MDTAVVLTEKETARAVAEYIHRQQMMESIEGGELMAYGFVHVTGLRTYDPLQSDPEKRWNIVTPAPASFGTLGTNNGFVVVITPKGNVWLGVYPDHFRGVSENDGYSRADKYHRLLRKLCPNSNGEDTGGNAAFAVIINCAELIPAWHTLHRMNDPHWKP